MFFGALVACCSEFRVRRSSMVVCCVCRFMFGALLFEVRACRSLCVACRLRYVARVVLCVV